MLATATRVRLSQLLEPLMKGSIRSYEYIEFQLQLQDAFPTNFYWPFVVVADPNSSHHQHQNCKQWAWEVNLGAFARHVRSACANCC